MSAGIMTGTRGARCNRGGRRRETPARLGARSAKPGPGSHLGMRESQGQSCGGTPEGERALQGAPAAQAAEDDPRLTAFRILLFLPFVPVQFVARVSEATPGSGEQAGHLFPDVGSAHPGYSRKRVSATESRSHRRAYLLGSALSESPPTKLGRQGAPRERECLRNGRGGRSMGRPPHPASSRARAGSRGP